MTLRTNTDYPTEPLGLVVKIQAPRVDARCACGWINTTRIRTTGRFDLLCGACGLPVTVQVIGGLTGEPLPAAPGAAVAGRGDHGGPTPAAAAEPLQQPLEEPVVADLDGHQGDTPAEQPEAPAAAPVAATAIEAHYRGEPSGAIGQGRQGSHLATPRKAVDLEDPETRMPLERWVKYDIDVRRLWGLLPLSHGTGRIVFCAARRCGWDGRRQLDWAEQPPAYTRAVVVAALRLALRSRGIAIPATGGELLEPIPPAPQMQVVVTEEAEETEPQGSGRIGQLDLLRQGLAEEVRRG